MPKTDIESKSAPRGEKTLELTVRFWTDDIVKKGKIRPKHGWAKGTVSMNTNSAHGIRSKSPIPFNSLLGLGVAIEKVLVKNGVTLHATGTTRKYIVSK
jgi:hypothetical protein